MNEKSAKNKTKKNERKNPKNKHDLKEISLEVCVSQMQFGTKKVEKFNQFVFAVLILLYSPT